MFLSLFIKHNFESKYRLCKKGSGHICRHTQQKHSESLCVFYSALMMCLFIELPFKIRSVHKKSRQNYMKHYERVKVGTKAQRSVLFTLHLNILPKPYMNGRIYLKLRLFLSYKRWFRQSKQRHILTFLWTTRPGDVCQSRSHK